MSVKFAHVTQSLQHYWEKYPALAWVVPLLWLLAIATVTLVWHVGSIGLIDETEPLFVEASRQMVLTGDWVTPSFDGEPRFDKPPLIYWLMVFAFQSFGVNEFAARLPSILAAVAIALFCFYTLQRYGELGVGSRESGVNGEAEGRGQEAEGKRQKAKGKRADSISAPHPSLLTPHSSPLSLLPPCSSSTPTPSFGDARATRICC